MKLRRQSIRPLAAALLGAALFLFLGHGAQAQGAVGQYGVGIPNHMSMYTDCCHITDAGGPQLLQNGLPTGPPQNNSLIGSLPSGLGFVNPTTPVCNWSGYANSAYTEFCLGFDSGGANALLQVDRIGGGTPPRLDCLVNGGLIQNCFSPSATSDIFAVATYGAKCDGATDDTAAIQATINAAAAAGGFAVVANTGSACMTAQLSLPSNTNLVINGTLKLKNGADQSMLQLASSATNITISGNGTLDGNDTNQTGTSGGIVNLGSPTYVSVSGLTIQNFLDWPFNLTNVSHARVSFVHALNNGHSFEYAGSGTSDCWADHLYINGVTDIGFAFYGGPSDCGISNSYITNTAGGIDVLNDGNGSNTSSPSNGVVISNNVVTGNRAYGISVATGIGATLPHTNITITGNIVTKNNTSNNSPPTGGDGIVLGHGNNLIVSNNQIYDDGNGVAGTFGINLQTVNDVVISGNMISDEGQGSVLGVGISFSMTGPPTNIEVIGNRIFDDQGTMTMAHDLNGTLSTGVYLASNHLGAAIGVADNTVKAADTITDEPPELDSGNALSFNSKIAVTGAAPALTSCGGGSPALDATASDAAGTITEGTTATGCVATFSTAYATAPHCTVSSPNGIALTSYSVSTTALTIVNPSADGDKFAYICTQ